MKIHKILSQEHYAMCGEIVSNERGSRAWDKVTCEQCLKLMSEQTRKTRITQKRNRELAGNRVVKVGCE